MCGIHVEMQNVYTISVGKREIKDYLENLAVDPYLQEECYENMDWNNVPFYSLMTGAVTAGLNVLHRRR